MDSEQRRHLLESYDIKPEMLDRLITDIWALTARDPQEWVQQRHAALQQSGLRNDEIWRTIQIELAQGRFAAPAYSLRQIRRLIYG